MFYILNMIGEVSEFIFVKITDEMRECAKVESRSYETKLVNSIRLGKGTYAGCLGEEMFHKVFPFLERVNNFQYDFSYGNITFDVKTKERTVKPQLHYDCSVNTMNGKQDVDYYIFAQVINTYEYGWILGMKKSDDFFKESTFHPEGSIDKRNNFMFHCDTYNMEINKLRPVKKPVNWLQ